MKIEKIRRLLRLCFTALRLAVTGRWATLRYGIVTQLKGLDLSPVGVSELGISPEHALCYHDSGGPELRSVLQSLAIEADARILDLGCGKAGAIITMSDFPFSQLVGLDLSAEMIRVAKANCERAGIADRVKLMQGDAAKFTDLDDVNYIYLFHPFSWEIFKSVCANLSDSLVRKARKVIMIYKYPVYHEQLLACGIFKFQQDFKFEPGGDGWNIFRIYVHHPNV